MTYLASFAVLEGLSGFLQHAYEMPLVNEVVLLLSVLTPLCVAISLAASGKLTEGQVKVAAGFGFFVPFLGALWLWSVYQASVSGGGYAFQFRADTGLEAFGILFHLGLNGVSMPLFVMAAIVGLASGIYALTSEFKRLRLYLILLLVMLTGLMGLFASIDVFFFYFFHEFALIPTFIMVAIWGGRGRKVIALEMTIYLTFGAMLTLAGLLTLYVFSDADYFNMLELSRVVEGIPAELTIFGLLLIGFGILVSLFPFHSWAPRAYSAAPASAAMLHAGVLKKFGLYGLIQIAWPLLPEGVAAWSPALMWLALGNILIIGFVTIAQRDLKLMLGNASVMHMGYAFLGLFAYSTVGLGGAVLMMFAHGLSVALLFLLADVIERRTGTTEFSELGGLGKSAPVLMGLFVAATMASIGLPGFANFWGELSIFVALFKSASPWVIAPAITGIIISAIYGLRAVARIFFGESKTEDPVGDIRTIEKIAAVVLLIALLAAGFWPRMISDNLNRAVSQMGLPEAPMEASAHTVSHPH